MWLDPARNIGHYHFLDTHVIRHAASPLPLVYEAFARVQMNVYIMPKDNMMVLKVQLGQQGEITRVLKVPPNTLVRDVCQQLALRYPVNDLADWGLIGKEKGATRARARSHSAAFVGKPVRLWLPDDEPLSHFPNINMVPINKRSRKPPQRSCLILLLLSPAFSFFSQARRRRQEKSSRVGSSDECRQTDDLRGRQSG